MLTLFGNCIIYVAPLICQLIKTNGRVHKWHQMVCTFNLHSTEARERSLLGWKRVGTKCGHLLWLQALLVKSCEPRRLEDVPLRWRQIWSTGYFWEPSLPLHNEMLPCKWDKLYTVNSLLIRCSTHWLSLVPWNELALIIIKSHPLLIGQWHQLLLSWWRDINVINVPFPLFQPPSNWIDGHAANPPFSRQLHAPIVCYFAFLFTGPHLTNDSLRWSS